MEAATRLWRRAIQMVSIGRGTVAVTDGGKVRTVQLSYTSMAATTDAVPVVQQYGFASRPHQGCDHVTVSLSGDLGRAVVVASNDQRYQFPLAEGESALFDDLGQSYHVTRQGLTQTDRFGNSITSSSTGWVLADLHGNQIVTNAAGITLISCTGQILVDNEIVGTQEGGTGASFTGTIKSTGDLIANTGAAQVSLLNHVHSNAGGSGNSGAPVPGT
jgi:phage gp45-like